MLTEPGDTIVVDALAHYTTYLSAEACGLQVKEVSHTDYPQYKTKDESYAEKIEETRVKL